MKSSSTIQEDSNRNAIQAFPLPEHNVTPMVVTAAAPYITDSVPRHYRFRCDVDVNICTGLVAPTVDDTLLRAGVDEYFFVPGNTQVNVFGAGTVILVPMNSSAV